MISQQSLESYSELKLENNKLSNAYLKILKALKKYPARLDIKRIAKVTKLSVNNVCGRLGYKELRNKEDPIVIDGGKKYCNITHRKVMTYKINPKYLKRLEGL